MFDNTGLGQNSTLKVWYSGRLGGAWWSVSGLKYVTEIKVGRKLEEVEEVGGYAIHADNIFVAREQAPVTWWFHRSRHPRVARQVPSILKNLDISSQTRIEDTEIKITRNNFETTYLHPKSDTKPWYPNPWRCWRQRGTRAFWAKFWISFNERKARHLRNVSLAEGAASLSDSSCRNLDCESAKMRIYLIRWEYDLGGIGKGFDRSGRSGYCCWGPRMMNSHLGQAPRRQIFSTLREGICRR